MRRLEARQTYQPRLSYPDASYSRQYRAGALFPTWTPPGYSVTDRSWSAGRTRSVTVSAISMFRQCQRAAGEPIERALENVRGGVLIDDPGTAGARHIRGDQLALDRGGGEPFVPEGDWKLGEPRKVACKGARGLRARTLAAVHVDGKPEHEGDRLPFRGKRKQPCRIGGERLARDGFDAGREPPVGIAGSNPDRLGAEIEPDQRAAGGQMRRRLGQGKDQCGHRRCVARAGGADYLQSPLPPLDATPPRCARRSIITGSGYGFRAPSLRSGPGMTSQLAQHQQRQQEEDRQREAENEKRCAATAGAE